MSASSTNTSLQTLCHTLIPLSITSLLQPMQHPISHYFSLLTSQIFFWLQLHCSPDLAVNRIHIWAVRWPHIWWDKFWVSQARCRWNR